MGLIKKRGNSGEERLDDASIERVMAYLEEKGATKKQACSMLNISYNTTRLDKLVETFITKKQDEARRRAEKRGKPVSPDEASFIISEYLAGKTIEAISKAIYRGNVAIKAVLTHYAVPERQRTHNYFKPNLIPEDAVRESFQVGETVYSARYDTLAVIDKEYVQNDEFIYRVYLRGDWLQYAMQPAHELASLDKLRTLGITL